MKALMKFIRDEEGLTTVEYAVAGSLIAGALVTAFTSLREAVIAAIEDIIAVL